MPSNHLILRCPLLLLPSIFLTIRVFSNESALCIRWPKYWSCSFNISPSNEHSGLISFRMDWLALLAVQGTLKSLLQHHTQSCPTLCDPMDYSLPGSSVHGILQARILEWVSISFSNAWKWKVKVKLLSHVWLFATPWIAARQASITGSRSSPKPMSIVSVMPSINVILCRPLLLLPSIFPNIRVFSNESALHIRWPKYWSFSFNIRPSMHTQDWSLGWTGRISLQSKGLSRVFSKTTVQKHQFFGTQLFL